ncbi:hypothetical protein FM119_02455 [Mycetocola reblochoni REB411]|uniref:Uncharacterized protein n=1 Tax=Mycetocola reblochoni REB411 TaxID=1255698 RepID=A0A1R4INI5_9MICO|nr:hypothetical protein FM119_02455 [Mycetocola reblochoni REB411]
MDYFGECEWEQERHRFRDWSDKELIEGWKVQPEHVDKYRRIMNGLGDTLIAKNQACGDSALNPVRIFSAADTTEQLKVRIDDKLSRLKRGNNAGEDVITDLIGYLVLLKIANRQEPE